MPCENESIEQHPGKQDGGEDDDERPRAAKGRDLIGESLAECLLLLKFQIGIVADRQALTDMLNDPMLMFSQSIKADLKPLLRKLSQLIVHSKSSKA